MCPLPAWRRHGFKLGIFGSAGDGTGDQRLRDLDAFIVSLYRFSRLVGFALRVAQGHIEIPAAGVRRGCNQLFESVFGLGPILRLPRVLRITDQGIQARNLLVVSLDFRELLFGRPGSC